MTRPRKSRFTRNQIWQHNGYSGSTRMAYQNMRTIATSPTATLPARALAASIAADLLRLHSLLKVRDEEPDG